MFGLFDGDRKRVQQIRRLFEEIRQRVYLRMDRFEQYSFGSVFENLPEEFLHRSETLAMSDKDGWMKLSADALKLAQEAHREYSKLSGMNGEGGRAGSEGVALFSLEAAAKAYNTAESLILRQDIAAFRKKMTDFASDPDRPDLTF